MAQLGADWSAARPGGAATRNAGIVGVGRYLTSPGDWRAIEKSELDDLLAHGINVWFVREGSANGMLGGYSQGVYDAQVAVSHLRNRLGIQGNQVIYAAADFDVQGYQFGACDDYMRGFASVIGLPYTGIYAGMYYINHCRDAGLANWFWKAAASSWDHGQGGAVHIEQTTKTPPLPGTDHNYIYTVNYGQIGSGPSSQEDDDMAIWASVDDWNMSFFVVPGKYVEYITADGPHVKAAQALSSKSVAFNSGEAQALLDMCAMGNISAADLKGLPNTGSKILVCNALSGFWTTNAVLSQDQIDQIKAPALTDAQVKAISDQISSGVSAGASADEVKKIVSESLSALKLGAING